MSKSLWGFLSCHCLIVLADFAISAENFWEKSGATCGLTLIYTDQTFKVCRACLLNNLDIQILPTFGLCSSCENNTTTNKTASEPNKPTDTAPVDCSLVVATSLASRQRRCRVLCKQLLLFCCLLLPGRVTSPYKIAGRYLERSLAGSCAPAATELTAKAYRKIYLVLPVPLLGDR